MSRSTSRGGKSKRTEKSKTGSKCKGISVKVGSILHNTNPETLRCRFIGCRCPFEGSCWLTC